MNDLWLNSNEKGLSKEGVGNRALILSCKRRVTVYRSLKDFLSVGDSAKRRQRRNAHATELFSGSCLSLRIQLDY